MLLRKATNLLGFFLLFTWGISIFFSLVTVSGLAQNELGPVSLCDYTRPETLYQDLGLDLNYHYYDDPFLGEAGDINRGSAFGDFDYIYANPDYSLNLNANTNISLSKDEMDYSASGSGRFNAYLTDTILFAFGGLQVDTSSSFTEPFGVRVITGSGFGRFKNVTPLVKATLINRMLLDRGVLVRDMSAELLKDVAREIDSIEPAGDVENAVSAIVSLIEVGAELEAEELGAVEVFRVTEIIEEGISPRLCGWEVRAGLGYEAIDPEGGERDFLVDAAARYARPFTPYSQLSLGVDFSSPFELTESYIINGLASYTYRFTDNFDTNFQYSLLFRRGAGTSFFRHNFSATAEVKVQRNVTTSVSLNFADQKGYEELTKELTVGISYNFL